MSAGIRDIIAGDPALRLALKPHPGFPEIPVEDLIAQGADAAALLEVCRVRHEAVARSMPFCPVTNKNGEPLVYGWKSRGYERVQRELARMRAEVPDGVLYVLMLGGNRAGKSDVCARMVMEILTREPQRRAWCFQGTQTVSREIQQPYIWRYFPSAWKPQNDAKGLKRTAVTKVVYTQGTGFSADSFVLPNGSQGDFKFYAADISVLQGPEQDVIWFDELVPLAWIEDAKFRLVTRNGIMLISFTPIEGYSDVVASFLGGVETANGVPCGPEVVESMDAELLPHRGPDGEVCGYERVPLVLRGSDPSRVVIWFPTEENFYGNYPAMKQTLARAGRAEILTRAYGVPLRKFGSVFTFRDQNVLSAAAAESVLLKATDYTWYHVMDPAGAGAARNAYMQWWAVAKNGQQLLMREWPQPGDYIPGVGSECGVWAERGGSADGTRGAAQPWFEGFGFEQVSKEIRRVEEELGAKCGAGRIPVEARFMDSRAGNATTLTTTGAVTLIEQWADLDAEHSLSFEPASGRQTTETGDTWKAMVQAALEIDPRLNAPRLMVAPACGNAIFSLRNWTGLDKEKGACKDPVDALKYFLLADAEWIAPRPPGAPQATAWSGYGARRK
jgi:phage terminase large subunit-like protein